MFFFFVLARKLSRRKLGARCHVFSLFSKTFPPKVGRVMSDYTVMSKPKDRPIPPNDYYYSRVGR